MLKANDVKQKGDVPMRKITIAIAALAAALALLLCACGWPGQRPPQSGETTAAYEETTGQQRTQASRKATVPAGGSADTAAAAPAATTQRQTTAAQAATTTRPATTTVPPTTTQPTTTATAPPTSAPQVFGGAAIVLATPGGAIDESLDASPRTVYALDMGGYRFHFQPRAYSPGGGLIIDVYLDNRNGSYTRVDTLSNAVQYAGTYSIALATSATAVIKDPLQDLTLLTNVYRFDLSPQSGRYTARHIELHAPYPLTAYYALDRSKLGAGVFKFNKITY